MDYITLTGVSAYGSHGVLESEHLEPQLFIVDAVLYLDLRDASRSDDLTDTVNYAQIAERIVSTIEGEHVDLIEKLAQRIADRILHSWRVRKTIVTVHKPQAPIEVPFGDVSVTIERSQPEGNGDEEINTTGHVVPVGESRKVTTGLVANDVNDLAANNPPVVYTAVIALGGNQGDVPRSMREAIVALDAVPGNQVTGISPLYRSKPWGVSSQQDVPDFYNAVVEVSTILTPSQLLRELHIIEDLHGRRRETHWDSRTLDLDIIDYAGRVSIDIDVTLPHPRAWQRAFVLKPWYDIAPEAFLEGVHGGYVSRLKDVAMDSAYVEKVSDDWIISGIAPLQA